ncbi:MAG: prepilin-type N-terminal cleavage/methylation domain-containing protein [Candidatus Paceibacterota bacterium]|jgi:prepilin-type N-terminal cleavage/methylation domain-containing protein
MAGIKENDPTRKKNSSGFTLIEMVIYVALFGIIMGMIFNMILFVYGMNKRITSYSSVTADAHSAMERIVYEVTNSKYFYLPTSNFTNYNYIAGKSGQLSIATEKYATVDDSISFMDFYVEGGTLFLNMDGFDPVPLTSSNVTVFDFDLDYFKNGQRESVRISLKARSASEPTIMIDLINTATIR